MRKCGEWARRGLSASAAWLERVTWWAGCSVACSLRAQPAHPPASTCNGWALGMIWVHSTLSLVARLLQTHSSNTTAFSLSYVIACATGCSVDGAARLGGSLEPVYQSHTCEKVQLGCPAHALNQPTSSHRQRSSRALLPHPHVLQASHLALPPARHLSPATKALLQHIGSAYQGCSRAEHLPQ